MTENPSEWRFGFRHCIPLKKNLQIDTKFNLTCFLRISSKTSIPAKTCVLIELENHIVIYQKVSHYSNKDVRKHLNTQLSVPPF
jgi:hypothetical protein